MNDGDGCAPTAPVVRIAFFGTDDFAVPTLEALFKLKGEMANGTGHVEKAAAIATEVEVRSCDLQYCTHPPGGGSSKTETHPLREIVSAVCLCCLPTI